MLSIRETKRTFSLLNLIALVACAALAFATFMAFAKRDAVLNELRSQYKPRPNMVLVDSIGDNSFVVLVGDGTRCRVDLVETVDTNDRKRVSRVLAKGVHVISTFYNSTSKEFGFSADGKLTYLKISEPVSSVNRYEGTGGGGPPQTTNIWTAIGQDAKQEWNVILNVLKEP